MHLSGILHDTILLFHLRNSKCIEWKDWYLIWKYIVLNIMWKMRKCINTYGQNIRKAILNGNNWCFSRAVSRNKHGFVLLKLPHQASCMAEAEARWSLSLAQWNVLCPLITCHTKIVFLDLISSFSLIPVYLIL